MLSKRGLEESHYARGLAYEALGQPDQAIFDYQIAIKLRPSYEEAAAGIQRLGGK
jgi:tetratricopeptide (TPR) repeat protein